MSGFGKFASVIAFIVFLIIVALAITGKHCEFTEQQTKSISDYENYKIELKQYDQLSIEEKAEAKAPIEIAFPGWKIYLLDKIGCKRNYPGRINLAGIGTFFKEKLGFNEGFLDFFYPHLFVGLLAGFWIYILYLVAQGSALLLPKNKYTRWTHIGRPAELARLKRSWLYLIGSHFWKIFPIAFLYAVLMELPFVHTALDVALLAFLRDNLLLRSLILAFYIGLLPAAIEEYGKYRIRKMWDMRIEEARQQKRYVREIAKS